MTCHPDAKVRLAVLKGLLVTRNSVAGLINRARDVNADVRMQAYSCLGHKVSLFGVPTGKHDTLLHLGLTDSDR